MDGGDGRDSVFSSKKEKRSNALNEVTNVCERSLPRPVFNLSDSSLGRTDAESSLGILSLDNFSDLNDFNALLSVDNVKNQKVKSMKKSFTASRTINENECKKSVENVIDGFETESLAASSSRTSESDSSSSDIEYDGTNIPELNMDYDPGQELLNSFRKLQVEDVPQISAEIDESRESQTERARNDGTKTAEVSVLRTTFTNFTPSYDLLAKKLMPSRVSDRRRSKIGSFLADDLHNNGATSNSSESNLSLSHSAVKLTGDNIDIGFHPEEISARSSSFGSASKNATGIKSYEPERFSKNTSETQNVYRSRNFRISELDEGSSKFSEKYSDISTGANSGNDLEKTAAKGLNTYGKSEEGRPSNYEDFLTDLAFRSNFLNELSEFHEENWHSQLGLSTQENFLPADEAIEIIKRDQEKFEQEHMFEINHESKLDRFSKSSVFSQQHQGEITAPSWFLDCNGSAMNSSRHISIGQLIAARTENLGSLSEDSNRERPFFGSVIMTPSREELSTQFESMESAGSISRQVIEERDKNDACNDQDDVRLSAIHPLLSDMSATDPLNIANRLLESSLAKKIAKPLPVCSLSKLDSSSSVSQFEQQSFLNNKSNVSKKTVSLHSVVYSSNGNERETQNKSDMKYYSSTPCSSLANTLNFPDVSSTQEKAVSDISSDTKSSLPSTACTSCQLCPTHQNIPAGSSRSSSSCSSGCSNVTVVRCVCQGAGVYMKQIGVSQDYTQSGVPTANVMQNLPVSYLPPSAMCNTYASMGNVNLMNMAMMYPIHQSFPKPMQGCAVSYAYDSLQTSDSESIKGPTELIFPDLIAIGDNQEIKVTLQNPQNACFFNVSVIAAFINGKPSPIHLAGVTVPQSIVQKSNNSTTEISVNLSPKYEAKIEIELQIAASFYPMEKAPKICAPLRTRIIFEAERPRVSLLYKNKDKMELGTIIAGSTVTETVTLINRGKASVPLKLSISEDNKGSNSFTFQVEQITRLKNSSTDDFQCLSPSLLLCRLPGSKDPSGLTQIDLPVVLIAGSNMDVSHTINASIESPLLNEVLSTMKVFASIAVVTLTLTGQVNMPLLMNAKKGCKSTHCLTLLNNSSIPVTLDLEVLPESESFAVNPATVYIQPMQSSRIVVTFLPLVDQILKCSLQAAARPHGKVYSIVQIVGEMKAAGEFPHRDSMARIYSAPENVCKQAASGLAYPSSILEVDQKFLAWGGVDIGQSVSKSFHIRNSTNETLKSRVFTKEKSGSFQIALEEDDKAILTTIELKPNEVKRMTVIYAPTEVGPSNGVLGFKLCNNDSGRPFRMRLSGYGGISKIRVIGLPQSESLGYHLDINLHGTKETAHSKIVLQNVGSQAAFVKVLVIGSYHQKAISDRIVIQPTEFVLSENESKSLFVACTCSNVSDYYGNNAEIINIFYGDEIMRQRIRKLANTTYALPSSDPRNNVNFNVPYCGEENVPDDPEYPNTPKDISLFYSSMKNIAIHAQITSDASFGNPNFTVMSVMQEHCTSSLFNMSGLPRRHTIEAQSPPVKDDIPKMNRHSLIQLPSEAASSQISETNNTVVPFCKSAEEKVKIDLWSVVPDGVVLSADNKDNRVLLINHSKSEMRFKLEWSVNIISVSPVSGIIPAKGKIGLRITIISHAHSKQYDDCEGCIKIMCGGSEKDVLVKVCKGMKKQKSLRTSFRQDVLPENLVSETLKNSICEMTSDAAIIQDILDFPDVLKLNSAVPNVTAESIIKMSSCENVHWNMDPISAVTNMVPEDNLFQDAPTIEFVPASGVIEKNEMTTTIIKLCSPVVGSFMQFFELSINAKDCSKKFSVKVEAKIYENLQQIKQLALPSSSEESKDKIPRPRLDKIRAESDTYEFPIVAPGKSDSLHVVLENRTTQDCKLNVRKLQPPFSMKSKSFVIRARKHVKIPVYFRPQRLGEFSASLIFSTASNQEISVKLKGSCDI